MADREKSKRKFLQGKRGIPAEIRTVTSRGLIERKPTARKGGKGVLSLMTVVLGATRVTVLRTKRQTRRMPGVKRTVFALKVDIPMVRPDVGIAQWPLKSTILTQEVVVDQDRAASLGRTVRIPVPCPHRLKKVMTLLKFRRFHRRKALPEVRRRGNPRKRPRSSTAAPVAVTGLGDQTALHSGGSC